jgi:lipoate synthase
MNRRVADAIKGLISGIFVTTSVNRDELKDEASYCETVRLQEEMPELLANFNSRFQELKKLLSNCKIL